MLLLPLMLLLLLQIQLAIRFVGGIVMLSHSVFVDVKRGWLLVDLLVLNEILVSLILAVHKFY